MLLLMQANARELWYLWEDFERRRKEQASNFTFNEICVYVCLQTC